LALCGDWRIAKATPSCRKSTKPDFSAPLAAMDQVNISKSIESISLQIAEKWWVKQHYSRDDLLNKLPTVTEFCCVSLDNKKSAKPSGLRV